MHHPIWSRFASLLPPPSCRPTIGEAFGARLTSLSVFFGHEGMWCGGVDLQNDPDWVDGLAASLPALHSLGLHVSGPATGTKFRPLLTVLGPQLRSLTLQTVWPCWLPDWLTPGVLPLLEHLALDATHGEVRADDAPDMRVDGGATVWAGWRHGARARSDGGISP